MPEAWKSAPKQSHCAGDVRSRHGRAAGCGITGVGAVARRPGICARSGDIRLDPVASIPGYRATAAKASYGIGASVQGPCRVGCGVKGGRIRNSRTSRAGVTGCDYHLDSGGFLRFNRRL